MAPPAADRPARHEVVEALLRPTRDRAEMALRLAVICALTTYVTEYYGTPEPALTAYLVFFLNRPERTTSLILNIALVLVITLVIAMIIPLAAAVVDAPAWRVAAMALGSFFFLFLASASKLRPIGPIVAMIVAYALDVLGLVPLGELATRGLLYAWLFVAIPAAVSFIVNLVAAPAPRTLAERAFAHRLRAAAAVLRGASPAERRAFEAWRDEGAGDMLQRLHLAGVEHGLTPGHKQKLEAAAHATSSILFVVDAIDADPSIPAVWRTDAARLLDEMAEAFERGGYPVRIALTPPDGLTAAAAALPRDLCDLLAQFTDPGPASEGAGGGEKAGFFLPDAFSNPAHVHYALKTTAAALFCYFLYVLLDWPGIHTCLITCYIVALGTAAETIEKLGLRILGCLAGAAAGTAAIVWIIPAIASIWGLLAVVFAGGFIGAWIAAGSPRVAYAGFQFAFAFFLCVIQGTGPDFDLTIARDRVIGILIGNLVTYLVFTRLWPVSLTARVESGFASLLAELEALGRLPRSERRRSAVAFQAKLAELRDDLKLLAYEPPALRPPLAWIAARRDALAAAVALQAPILLDDDRRFWTALSHRVGALAKREPAPRARLVPANSAQTQARDRVMTMEAALALHS